MLEQISEGLSTLRNISLVILVLAIISGAVILGIDWFKTVIGICIVVAIFMFVILPNL